MFLGKSLCPPLEECFRVKRDKAFSKCGMHTWEILRVIHTLHSTLNNSEKVIPLDSLENILIKEKVSAWYLGL